MVSNININVSEPLNDIVRAARKAVDNAHADGVASGMRAAARYLEGEGFVEASWALKKLDGTK